MYILISITGPIATGATTLACRLADLVGWTTTLEADVEQTHPFFAHYNADPARYSFHNQVAFLRRSAEVHDQLRQLARNNTVYVQDYSPFEHTEVYAHVQHARGRLSEEEYREIQRLTQVIEPFYIRPDVLIYRPLHRQRLYQRIRERGRPSEQLIDLEFLEAIQQRFEQWIASWTRSPLIHLPEDFDALADTAGVRELAERIEAILARTDHQNPTNQVTLVA
jgi:deoxyadenosine/deoxycytidine kinase